MDLSSSAVAAAPAPANIIISTVPHLKSLITTLSASTALYVDLEGRDLGCRGTICLITVLGMPQNIVKIIDVTTLKSRAFNTPSPTTNRTLRSIFADPAVSKRFWGVFNDASALRAQYRVALAGVTDVQLLEVAHRGGDWDRPLGLDTCIHRDLDLGPLESEHLVRAKRAMAGRMRTDRTLFSARPLPDQTVQYCIGDVLYLPRLHDMYLPRARERGCLPMVTAKTERRVAGKTRRSMCTLAGPVRPPSTGSVVFRGRAGWQGTLVSCATAGAAAVYATSLLRK